jgi:steroid 5-alpha reductase family enzyme
MDKITMRSLVAVTVSVVLAYFIAEMNETYSQQLNGYSLYLIAAIIAFALNWLAFIPSFIAQTEHYYDITGTLTYLSILAFLFFSANLMSNPRALLLIALPSIWTLRLGSFLFSRIKKSGKDSRFDNIKPNFFRFFTSWTLQALWAFLTLSAALAVITSTQNIPLGIYALLGVIVWVIGFGIEVTADRQKTIFKENPDNKGKFISSGLWAYSRHPNYFGEILLWIGIFIICIPVLQGTQWITIISPIFIYVLLKYVSGINLLEAKADKTWGGQPEYEEYKKNTSELFLWP